MTTQDGRLPLALTMGEPAGIGGEIVLKAWANHRASLPSFFVIDDLARLEHVAADLGLSVALYPITAPAETQAVFPKGLPILAQHIPKQPKPGRPEPENVPAVLDAIRRAVAIVQEKHAAAIVTLPIHKHTLMAAGFAYPGHTEFLAHLAGNGIEPVMMLVTDTLRVVLVTIHEPFRAITDHLTKERIVLCGKTAAKALAHDFGISNPRLAVAALNPHAGEMGMLGYEEREIIAPAVTALRQFGITVAGPLAADTLFHSKARETYDAVLCMYHDQAMIPLKTIDFRGGVNMTLGLPFIRTSPDHGTAFDISGQGLADETSLVAAIRLANAITIHRHKAKVPA